MMHVRAIHYEDNEAAIRILQSGKNPTMRHIARTQAIDIEWLHERYSRDGEFDIQYCDSNKMAADIFTKAFPTKDRAKWEIDLKLIGHFDATFLRSLALPGKAVPASPGKISERGPKGFPDHKWNSYVFAGGQHTPLLTAIYANIAADLNPIWVKTKSGLKAAPSFV
jgi:hypothetical protein